ncbi:MAG: hypothetical protein OEZ39_17095 [Gammaproteobacteria bacterium]|nr:hypothetical protein [Gammaproteobacteria bacterium]MDH5653579.1 hypothetical protein [Gammaproteobacteria bacterium]
MGTSSGKYTNDKQRGGTMKKLLLALVMITITGVALAHGGGCRKSSPAGLCCHMDHKTGVVHCH